MELASCNLYDTQNFEVSSRLLENLLTSVLIYFNYQYKFSGKPVTLTMPS